MDLKRNLVLISADQLHFFILKEIIDMYRVLNGSVFICFLDASKAFDGVNHSLLFDKLLKRGVPGYIVRLLVFWYTNQKMCVSNGVRQGGMLSPLLFNYLYMDDLSDRLNKLKIEYCINGIVALTDNADIARQCRQLYAQGNMILRKFHVYSRCEIDSISHLLYPNVHITAMVEL